MKKIILCSLLFVSFSINAQEIYFTYYNFSVESQNEAAVLKIVDDYFKDHKKEGVTVRFFENHFNDSGNNFTHSIGFSGSSEAMGGQYSGAQSESWDLFLSRVNQLIKNTHSAFMGTIVSIHGETNSTYPIQKYIFLEVKNPTTFLTAREKYFLKFDHGARLTVLGNITSGRSPHGETHMVLQGYKDFKSAMSGLDALLTLKQVEARKKAWKEFGETNGGVKVVRSGTRILLGKW